MVSLQDDKRGVVKTNWADIRHRVSSVEPRFAAIVDEFSPDDTFPLFIVYYPYGALTIDTLSTYLPDETGNYYRLSDQDAPSEIIQHLGYGQDGSPMGMVLEKQLEYFIDLKDKHITIPWLIYSPGQCFPFSTILGCFSDRIYAPNGLLSATAGARSTFILPNIGCNTHHANLQRDFNIKKQAPKVLYDHWALFKDLIHHDSHASEWNACVLYFSEKWVQKLQTDRAWSPLRLYLYETAWRKFEYDRNRVYYDFAFSLIQDKRNLKPNPYLSDTAKHLFKIALGIAPGFVPTCDDEALPSSFLQKVFVESYGLKKYFPTIMHPTHYNFETDSLPIYYSLQNPSTHTFSPRSREACSTLFEMRELDHIMGVFCEELGGSGFCSDTIMGAIAKLTQFRYYHNKLDSHHVVHPSSDLFDFDPRFQASTILQSPNSVGFASDATFVRGCVSIQTK